MNYRIFNYIFIIIHRLQQGSAKSGPRAKKLGRGPYVCAVFRAGLCRPLGYSNSVILIEPFLIKKKAEP